MLSIIIIVHDINNLFSRIIIMFFLVTDEMLRQLGPIKLYTCFIKHNVFFSRGFDFT